MEKLLSFLPPVTVQEPETLLQAAAAAIMMVVLIVFAAVCFYAFVEG